VRFYYFLNYLEELIMIKEFKDFIAKCNVMDLAVGIVIGAAFTAIVKSMVTDLVNSGIGLFMGGVDFVNLFIPSKGSRNLCITRSGTRFRGSCLCLWGLYHGGD
jgi:large conductance mechanosensitive channel